MPLPSVFHCLFEDVHLIVLDKPAGLLSQGDSSQEASLVDLLRQWFGRHYVGLVHRLDRNTSGIMVVAKRSKAAERLTLQLQDGRLERRYLAWVEGVPGPEGSVHRYENWLIKDEAANESRAYPSLAPKPAPNARRAALELRVLKNGSRSGVALSLCEFRLETGRSHQIRVQAAFHGHPLVGDRKYGSRVAFPRPALHSHWIAFEHPISHERLEFECPPPEDFASLTQPD
jgi:23S rRNA pseudouridine1911/1915/1917 synthase